MDSRNLGGIYTTSNSYNGREVSSDALRYGDWGGHYSKPFIICSQVCNHRRADTPCLPQNKETEQVGDGDAEEAV